MRRAVRAASKPRAPDERRLEFSMTDRDWPANRRFPAGKWRWARCVSGEHASALDPRKPDAATNAPTSLHRPGTTDPENRAHTVQRVEPRRPAPRQPRKFHSLVAA